jgi:hypothetical protein
MTTIIQGDQLRALLLGVRVERPATTLVQDTGTDLFDVTGGKVVLTSLIGVVSTAVANTASLTITLQHTPTGGSAAALAAATVVTNDGLGTFYSLTMGAAAELISQETEAGTEAPNVTYAQICRQPIVLPAGTVRVLVSDHDPGTGAVQWTATYIPYDDGSAISVA